MNFFSCSFSAGTSTKSRQHVFWINSSPLKNRESFFNGIQSLFHSYTFFCHYLYKKCVSTQALPTRYNSVMISVTADMTVPDGIVVYLPQHKHNYIYSQTDNKSLNGWPIHLVFLVCGMEKLCKSLQEIYIAGIYGLGALSLLLSH